MLIIIDALLDAAALTDYRRQLADAEWEDGRRTASGPALAVKRNQQLAADSALGQSLGRDLLGRIGAHPEFVSAALPARIYPPRFNRYRDGGEYGAHVDASIMRDPQSGRSLRTDLSITLFLSDPDSYDGGELEIDTGFGSQSVKLAAGDLVLYPASSLHRVNPVQRGERLAAFFWLQSLVRDAEQRRHLYELDLAIRALSASLDSHPALTQLTGIYHNLLRGWAAD